MTNLILQTELPLLVLILLVGGSVPPHPPPAGGPASSKASQGRTVRPAYRVGR
jgi:hypothetical protein